MYKFCFCFAVCCFVCQNFNHSVGKPIKHKQKLTLVFKPPNRKKNISAVLLKSPCMGFALLYAKHSTACIRTTEKENQIVKINYIVFILLLHTFSNDLDADELPGLILAQATAPTSGRIIVW